MLRVLPIATPNIVVAGTTTFKAGPYCLAGAPPGVGTGAGSGSGHGMVSSVTVG